MYIAKYATGCALHPVVARHHVLLLAEVLEKEQAGKANCRSYVSGLNIVQQQTYESTHGDWCSQRSHQTRGYQSCRTARLRCCLPSFRTAVGPNDSEGWTDRRVIGLAVASTYAFDTDGTGGEIADDEADAPDHVALVERLVASAAEHSNEDLRRYTQGVREGGSAEREKTTDVRIRWTRWAPSTGCRE